MELATALGPPNRDIKKLVIQSDPLACAFDQQIISAAGRVLLQDILFVIWINHAKEQKSAG